MEQTLILQRIFDNKKESTIGYIVYDNNLMYTMEDPFREDKIKGITRIPAGKYKLGIRLEMSEKTKQYKAKFPWFKWHIQLLDVPGFEFVYIHIGNFAKDTDGCILVAETPNNNSIHDGVISNSTPIFEKFYKWIFPKLQASEEIYLEIRDELS